MAGGTNVCTRIVSWCLTVSVGLLCRNTLHINADARALENSTISSAIAEMAVVIIV